MLQELVNNRDSNSAWYRLDQYNGTVYLNMSSYSSRDDSAFSYHIYDADAIQKVCKIIDYIDDENWEAAEKMLAKRREQVLFYDEIYKINKK